MYTVSFFGHRVIEDLCNVEKKVDDIVKSLIKEKGSVEFLVGRNGVFDMVVSSAVKRAKKSNVNGEIYLVLIMPYETSELKENQKYFAEYYDEIEICQYACVNHPKGAYQIRNRKMVDRSDLVVFYVKNDFGGAYQTMKYAYKTKKTIVNLFELLEK